jgi:hypothetical protein
MTEKLIQKSKEELAKMPKDLQDAVASLGWEKISDELGQKYFLNESDTNNMQAEILLVMIGLANADDIVINIENRVGTSEEKAKSLGKEIFEKIFDPLANELTKKIKEHIKEKTPDWKQNLSFILSGGDYSVFLQTPNVNEKLQEKPETEKTPINYSKIEDLKNNFTI